MSELMPSACAQDADLVQVLENYLEALEAGTAPPREELLAQHPKLAEQLDACLGSLDFIRRATVKPASALSPASEAEKGREGTRGKKAPVHDAPAEVLGDYRLVREVGRGGMGIVYEAEQLSLDRRVALKMLPFAAALDPKQLQRFQNEAQAAALLHHDHIVPVYDVGCIRDVHFYVMRFIEGHNLAGVIRELRLLSGPGTPAAAEPASSARALASGLASGRWEPLPGSADTRRPGDAPTATGSTAERSAVAPPAGHLVAGAAFLRTAAHLGLQAAEALEQAHQVGVVHRDIKPANLLVDAHGHLWVTDFGLARVQNDASLTRTGDVVGTLRYMSPEQALGRRAVVDHRTDIYSLGVTLYELVTLQPAFAGTDRQELLRQIAHDEPPVPRRLNHAIPARLETILLKAVAKEPAERYATAQELAEDLRRFLADKPIVARRPSLAERARKWAGRHRRVVAGGVAAMLLAVAILTVSTLFIAQQRDEARRRGAQARRAVDEMYTEVAQRWWHQQPYMERVQREFLLKALRFYEEFAAEQGGDPEVRLGAAQAARRVGDIQHKLGQHDKAAAAYGQAIARLEQLASAFPAEAGYRDELANAHNNHGNLLRDLGRLEAAAQAYRQAQGLFATLAADSPGPPAYRDGLAGSHNNLSLVLQALGRPREAETAYRQALELFTALTQECPRVAAYQHALASSRNNLANLLRDTGRPREARAAYEQALALWQQLTADAPGVPIYRQSLAAAYSGLGVVRAAAGQLREAEAAHRQALALRERLANDFPGVPAYRQALAASLHSLARTLAAAGSVPEAQAAYDQAKVLRQKLAAEFPAVPAHRQELADTHHGMGNLLAAAGQPRPAADAYRQALALRKKLADESPDVPEYRWDLARTHHAHGNLLRAQRALPEAEAAQRAALGLLEQLTASFPRVPAYQLELAAARNGLGLVLQDTERWADAEKAHRAALAVRQRLATDYPAAPYYQFELAVGQNHLGTLLQRTGRPDEAARAYRAALALAEHLTSDFPALPDYLRLLAECQGRLDELSTAPAPSAAKPQP
jgi:serine/threonine protein kinase/Flp pilus assembly protein TadD